MMLNLINTIKYKIVLFNKFNKNKAKIHLSTKYNKRIKLLRKNLHRQLFSLQKIIIKEAYIVKGVYHIFSNNNYKTNNKA